MSKKEKIEELKLALGIKDNRLAVNYLNKAEWDVEEEKRLYRLENSKQSPRINNENEIETIKTERLKTINETTQPKNKDLYKDYLKFLKDKFPNIASNFNEFLSLLEHNGGLIIISPEEKINEVRNNMIRASNDKFCVDIFKNATILPILKDSEIAKELTKEFSLKNYPLYIFCKYKDKDKMEIKSRVESKFWLKDVIETLLDCIPETDTKEQIIQSLSKTLSLDGENTEIKCNFGWDSDDQNSIFHLNEFLNTTLWNANRDESINIAININNDNNTESNIQQIHLQANDILNEITNPNRDSSNSESNNLNELTTRAFTQIGEQNISNITNDNLPNENNSYEVSKCKIKFHYPNTTRYKIQKFNKTEKISSLFNFVESLGRDIYENQNFNGFELIHGFPPKYLAEVKNNTIEQEGLFPFSEVYIIVK